MDNNAEIERQRDALLVACKNSRALLKGDDKNAGMVVDILFDAIRDAGLGVATTPDDAMSAEMESCGARFGWEQVQ